MLKKIITAVLYCALSACSSLHNTQTEDTAIAEINAKLALAYLDRNDPASGKEKLLLAQKKAPFNPVVWYVSGYFLERTGDNTAANEAYLRAIELAPHLGAAHNNYGTFLCRQGQYAAAISHFMVAIKDPEYLNTTGAHENMARCSKHLEYGRPVKHAQTAHPPPALAET
jgi:type IV pilus assembly protein PilF